MATKRTSVYSSPADQLTTLRGEDPIKPLAAKPLRISPTETGRRQSRLVNVGLYRTEDDMEAMNQAVQGANFTRNWIREASRNGNMGLDPAKGNEIANSIRNPIISMGMGTTGGYYNGSDSVVVRGSDTKSVATHETTHALQHQLRSVYGQQTDSPMQTTLSNIKQQVESSPVTYDGSKDSPGYGKEYFGEPNEIHARIGQIRQGMELTPSTTLDRKAFDGYMNKMNDHTQQLRKVLSDDQIFDLLDPNKTVMNKKSSRLPNPISIS